VDIVLPVADSLFWAKSGLIPYPSIAYRLGVILFAVTEFFATGSQVPLLLVIDAI
jgi:hypothetical protein